MPLKLWLPLCLLVLLIFISVSAAHKHSRRHRDSLITPTELTSTTTNKSFIESFHDNYEVSPTSVFTEEKTVKRGVYADECRNKCGQNETCNSCGNQCELNCSDIHKNICPLICNSAACACDPEYARDNLTGKCIHKLQCPQYK